MAATFDPILGRLRSKDLPVGVRPLVLMELGLSLQDQGRSPSYSVNTGAGRPGTYIRWTTAVNPFSYISRWTGGIRILESAGKSGDTITGALARISEVTASSKKPDICAIWLGGNDINAISNWDAASTAFETMKANFAAICNTLKAAGIEPWVMQLPYNAVWQGINYRMSTFHKLNRWVASYCRENDILLIPLTDAVLARPERQVTGVGKTVSRASNVITVTWAAHGFSTGDYVTILRSIPSSLDVNDYTAITVIDANTFTLASNGVNASGTGDVTRSGVYPSRVSDGATHLSEKGAGLIARLIYNQVKNLIPMIDTLPNYDDNYCNLIGAGTSLAGSRISLSTFSGTGGTASGSGTQTGNVPAGWTSSIIAGNPTITHSSVARTEAGLTHRTWWQIQIAAAAADAQLAIYIDHPLPSVWSTGSIAAGTWVRPTVANGYWYYSESGGTQTGSEPTWPTEPGQTVTSGGITWECRLGWNPGDIVCAEAEGYIESVTDGDSIECISFGLFDESNGTNDIKEHHFQNVTNPPQYQAGDPLFFRTPEVDIATDTTSLRYGWKIRVGSGKSATIKLDRPAWWKVS